MQKRDWTGWKFVGPFMIVFALVLIAPVLYSIYLSFFQDQLIGGNSFVGFDNYGQALTDPKFWESFGRVTLFLVVQVPIMLGIALFAALAIDSARLHVSSFFRIAIFLPYAVPAVVATLMWGFIYGTQFGLVGNLNDFFGIAIPDPLSQTWMLAVDRQHRHLGVHRLQHADLLRRPPGRSPPTSTRRPRSTAPARSASSAASRSRRCAAPS